MPQIDGEGFESKLKQVSLQSTCSLLPQSEDGSFFLPLQKGQLNKDIAVRISRKSVTFLARF